MLRRSIRTAFLLLPLFGGLALAGCDGEAEAKKEVKVEADASAAVAVDANAEKSAVVKTEVAVAGDADVSVTAKVADQAQAIAEGTAAVEVQLKADAIDLDGITALIKKGKVKSAKDLEKAINNPKKKLAKVDIDADGTLDFVQVVEVRKEDQVVFELRVIPSSKKSAEVAVTAATIAVVPDKASAKVTVHAEYTAVVEHHEVYVYEYAVPATWEGDVVIVAGNPFFGWVFTVERDVYVGVYVHEEWVAVPGVVIVIGVDVDGGCWPPGHCKHGKFKKHGKWH